MAYLKPPLFVKHVFNPLAMATGISGVKTLKIKRRESGEVQKIPVITAEFDGNTYLVSTRGESDWVKNLRAADGKLELNGEAFIGMEVHPEQREPVIEAYREKAGKTVDGYFKKLPDAADHPVFMLEPAA